MKQSRKGFVMSMYKIGVVGDKESIQGFTAIGLEVFSVRDDLECSAILNDLAKNEYAIIFITEQAAIGVADTIALYKDSRLPAIIMIPSNKGSLGMGIAGIKKSVERAVGADILFKE